MEEGPPKIMVEL